RCSTARCSTAWPISIHPMAARSRGWRRCCGSCLSYKRRHSGTVRRTGPGMTKVTGGHVTDTFDFVVVGAGSGGCAVAGRLSEDASTSVALLDAGGKNDNWRITTPFGLALPYKAAK